MNPPAGKTRARAETVSIESDGANPLDALQRIAACMSGAVGESFFERLVEQLALATHASAAFVAERDPKREDAVQTVAVWMDGAIRPNFEYELRGTPCEQVFDRTPSEFPTGVQAAFPEDR